MEYLYLGYYHNILLVADEDKSEVKKYLKHIRNLSSYDYHIKKVEFNNSNGIKYADYILEEFYKDLYLPARDCTILSKDIERELYSYTDTLNGMKEFYKSICRIDHLDEQATNLLTSIRDMENTLSSNKSIKKIKKAIAKKSLVLSRDIELYCQVLHVDQYNRELDMEYQYHLRYD